MLYAFILIISIATAAVLAFLVRHLALALKIQDLPKGPRKLHKQPVPLMGGLAVFLAFFGIAFALLYLHILPQTMARPLFWLFAASAFLMLGGFLDDKYSLPAKLQIIFPLAAVLLALYGGIKIGMVTNPFGGILRLGIGVSLVLSFVWLLGITYTTKILDGLDGLVSGVVSLGALSIFLFTTVSEFKENGVPYLAVALAGTFAGFLFLNAYPAKIFLGEGGSLFAGFILGSLAILTGAKIAVTLMVLAMPLIDLLAVVIKRAFFKKKSIFSGDRLHMHFFLVDRGWKIQNVVYIYWLFAAMLGGAAIFLPSGAKIAALLGVSFAFFLVDLFLVKEK